MIVNYAGANRLMTKNSSMVFARMFAFGRCDYPPGKVTGELYGVRRVEITLWVS